MRRYVVDLLLLAAVVAVVAVGLVFGAGRSSGGEGEAFAGTDSAATEAVSSQGHEPWFQPIFSPGSAEVESGLFAVQAAVGAGALGYCLGVLRGRRTVVRSRGAFESVADDDAAGAAEADSTDVRRARDRG